MKSTASKRKLLSLRIIAQRLDVSESTAKRLKKKGAFGDPIQISPGCVRYDEMLVNEYIRTRSYPKKESIPDNLSFLFPNPDWVVDHICPK